MKKRYTNVSVSFDLERLSKVDKYVEENGGSFSKFIRDAVDSYLDHNQNVTEVSINDSKVDEIIKESIKDIPEDTEPPPKYTSDNLKSDFNFDDVSFKS